MKSGRMELKKTCYGIQILSNTEYDLYFTASLSELELTIYVNYSN